MFFNDLVVAGYGMGSGIVVEAFQTPLPPHFGHEGRQILARILGAVLQTHFPSAEIAVFVQKSDSAIGFWNSAIGQEEAAAQRGSFAQGNVAIDS